MGYGSVSVGTGNATLILAANSQRLSLIIVNGGSNNLYVGQDAGVTTANTVFIVPNGTLTEDSGGTKMYCGPFYGCSAGTATTADYWERTR